MASGLREVACAVLELPSGIETITPGFAHVFGIEKVLDPETEFDPFREEALKIIVQAQVLDEIGSELPFFTAGIVDVLFSYVFPIPFEGELMTSFLFLLLQKGVFNAASPDPLRAEGDRGVLPLDLSLSPFVEVIDEFRELFDPVLAVGCVQSEIEGSKGTPSCLELRPAPV